MEKKKIYGDSLRAQLEASARDKMYRFMLDKGSGRGVIIHATKLVSEMRFNHDLGILETLILGYGYLGALLLGSSLKGAERLVLEITCTGPLRGLAVEANAFGEVRGYLKEKHIPLDSPLESFDLSPFWQEGVLSVTRFLTDSKAPFTGKVKLDSGSLAMNLAHYSLQSEQTPSSYSLSVHFNKKGEVRGAGALLVQALPGASDGELKALESIVRSLPSIGKEYAEGVSPQGLVLQHLAAHDPEFLSDKRVVFMCHCNRNRFLKFLGAIDREELADIVANGPFPVVLTCHNCNTNYEFPKEEVEKVYGGK